MKQSRIYEVDGLFIDLSRLASVSSLLEENFKYKFFFIVVDGERTRWTTSASDKLTAQSCRNNLIKAWITYWDERDGFEKQKETPQEDPKINPVDSLEV